MSTVKSLIRSTNSLLLFYTLTLVIASFDHVLCSIESLQSKETVPLHQRQDHQHQHLIKQTPSPPTGLKPAHKLTEISSSRQLRKKCSTAARELDRCSAQIIGLGQGSATYPDSMQELNSVYCPKFRELVACIKNNTECYKPFERQIINWVLTSTRKMNYKRCKSENENEKQRFLRLTNSCFATMRNPMDECMGHYIGSLDAIADLEQSKNDHQIQLSCCANRRFKQCIMDSAKQKCKSHDSLKKLRRTNSNTSQRVARKQMLGAVRDTMEDLKSTLDEMALTGPEFICTKIDEKFCKSKFDGRFTNRLAQHDSIVPAMLRIYANS